MNGSYDDEFPQARALYMYAHTGKKLNFMGNENGQLREWNEKTEQDWNLLSYSKHDSFHQFMKTLNDIYMKNPALYEKDYEKDGFEWIACKNEGSAVYAFFRNGTNQTILSVTVEKNMAAICLEPFSAKYYIVEKCTLSV